MLDNISNIKNISQVKVRLKTPDITDLPMLLEMDELAKKASTGTGFPQERQKEREYKLEKIIRGEEPETKLYVIETIDNASKVGAISIEISPRPIKNKIDMLGLHNNDIDDKGKRWHIGGSAIKEECRRHGYWKESMLLLENEAIISGVKYLTTDVGKDNEPIINARRSMGFVFYEDPLAEASGYKPGTKMFAIKTI